MIDHGFRLPSAADNRPLRFDEFVERVNQVVFLSATPGAYELQHSQAIVEQIVRPTGLVDPEIIVKPTKGQIDDLIEMINERVAVDARVLVTTLTKKMAEDLTDYLLEQGLRVRYLHSNIDTIERIEILRDLRLGEFDVLVGINLLREGLDLPEVSLVAILDADKEGFLRSETVAHPDHRARRSQRRRPGGDVRRQGHRLDAARHLRDAAAPQAAGGVQRRARHRPADDPQGGHRHPGAPASGADGARCRARTNGPTRRDRTHAELAELPAGELERLVRTLEEEMHDAATDLRFEYAARLRDEIKDLKRELREVG